MSAAEAETSRQPGLRIAYVVQNAGGVDLALDIGDSIPVKFTLQGLRRAGHLVRFLKLAGDQVLAFSGIDGTDPGGVVSLGITGTRLFRLMEGGIRRLQRRLGIPYFALFDSIRFYEACLRFLPSFDVCHEHNGLFSAGAALACKRLGIPYILTFSADPLFELEWVGTPLKGVNRAVAARVARWTYRQAGMILCVSAAAKRQLVEEWQVDPSKIVVMPNGVDTDLFKPEKPDEQLRIELGLAGAPTVVFVGGLQPWHDLVGLIQSFAQVIKEVPEARLLIVGDGPERFKLERALSLAGISHAVHVTGLVPHASVPKLLALADVATVPYPRFPKELWFSPLKLYEYMAAGKAIVATGGGQIDQVLEDHWDGLLVEPGDQKAFADAIVYLLNYPEDRARMGERARRKVTQNHAWDHYVLNLENIYYSAIQGEDRS